jgi:uncharacterized membrane protein
MYMTRLRNYFLTGLIICAPLAITVYLVKSMVGWVDGWVQPYLPSVYNPDTYLPFHLPGFGLIVAVFVITMIGFLTANFVGRSIIRYGEKLLDRMPLVRGLYKALKQIFETVLSNKESMFNKVGLLEYPRKDLWSIVFIAGDTKSEVSTLLKEKYETVAVFMPCTPNPTTGYLVYVPRSEIIPLSMSVEDAAKLVISAGMVAPEYHAKTKILADAARGELVSLADIQPARKSRTASSRSKK